MNSLNIQTSYLASRAPKERKVRIAKKPYRFAPHLPSAGYFAPSDPWANNWRQAYRADLDARFPTPEVLRKSLEILCREVPAPILCCYEKDPSQCHRSILAAYIKEKLGLDVPEWQPDATDAAPKKSRKKSGIPQLNLLSLL